MKKFKEFINNDHIKITSITPFVTKDNVFSIKAKFYIENKVYYGIFNAFNDLDTITIEKDSDDFACQVINHLNDEETKIISQKMSSLFNNEIDNIIKQLKDYFMGYIY